MNKTGDDLNSKFPVFLFNTFIWALGADDKIGLSYHRYHNVNPIIYNRISGNVYISNNLLHCIIGQLTRRFSIKIILVWFTIEFEHNKRPIAKAKQREKEMRATNITRKLTPRFEGEIPGYYCRIFTKFQGLFSSKSCPTRDQRIRFQLAEKKTLPAPPYLQNWPSPRPWFPIRYAVRPTGGWLILRFCKFLTVKFVL